MIIYQKQTSKSTSFHIKNINFVRSKLLQKEKNKLNSD